MRIIPPIQITDSQLVSSNVDEDEYSSWDEITAYTTGDTVIFQHKIYECLVNNTDVEPTTGVSTIPAKWLDLGYTNRWKMFDDKTGSQTTNEDSIEIELVLNETYDSVAFLDVDGTTISVTMTDSIEGVVYSSVIDLVSKEIIDDAYKYFFSPIITDDAAILLGIPPYSSATLSIVINNPDATAAIGTLAIGMQKDLGATKYEPGIGIIDYSKKEVDTFGNYNVLQRSFSKRLNCELHIANNTVDELFRLLSQYRATPIVWVGSDVGFSSMLVYGFYRNFEITIPYYEYSVCTIEIEGLS